MRNEKLSNTIAQACLIGGLFLLVLQCAFGQITNTIALPAAEASSVIVPDTSSLWVSANSICPSFVLRTPPSNQPDFAWNNAPYFRSYDYIKAPDKRFFDWKSYTVTWDGKQAAIWGLYALSGVAHGIREAYHADPYLFERRNGVEPTSFWGSDAWKRNYYHNDPEGHHKREFFGNVGRDVWHTFNQVDLVPLGISIAASAKRKHPLKYQIANTLVGLGLRVLFVNITYATLRNTR